MIGSHLEETGEGRVKASMLLPWLLTYVCSFPGSATLRFGTMMGFLLTPQGWSAEHVGVGVERRFTSWGVGIFVFLTSSATVILPVSHGGYLLTNLAISGVSPRTLTGTTEVNPRLGWG